jgi:hypothetical protein
MFSATVLGVYEPMLTLFLTAIFMSLVSLQ